MAATLFLYGADHPFELAMVYAMDPIGLTASNHGPWIITFFPLRIHTDQCANCNKKYIVPSG